MGEWNEPMYSREAEFEIEDARLPVRTLEGLESRCAEFLAEAEPTQEQLYKYVRAEILLAESALRLSGEELVREWRKLMGDNFECSKQLEQLLLQHLGPRT